MEKEQTLTREELAALGNMYLNVLLSESRLKTANKSILDNQNVTYSERKALMEHIEVAEQHLGDARKRLELLINQGLKAVVPQAAPNGE
jgi:hypothetical protein